MRRANRFSPLHRFAFTCPLCGKRHSTHTARGKCAPRDQEQPKA